MKELLKIAAPWSGFALGLISLPLVLIWFTPNWRTSACLIATGVLLLAWNLLRAVFYRRAMVAAQQRAEQAVREHDHTP